MIYLASPYRKATPDVRYWRFIAACKAAALLTKNGMSVVSPIAHSHAVSINGDIDPIDEKLHTPLCNELLLRSDMLFVLQIPGWDISDGVRKEMALAIKHKIPIVYIQVVTE